jgi:hypothetical protein
MWDKLQVVTEVVLLAVAVWIFAATFDPSRPWAFGRPVAPRVLLVLRVLSVLAACLCLVILVLDVFFR